MKNHPIRCLLLIAATCSALSGAEAAEPSPWRPQCNVATLQGVYAFEFSGHLAGGEAFASVGVQTFDGQGNFEVVGTTSIGGFVIRPSEFYGSYELGRDCQGTMYAVYPDGSTGEADIVSVTGGRQILAILASPGMIVTGRMTKM